MTLLARVAQLAGAPGREPGGWECEFPKPFSSNPTQWLFNGQSKVSDQPLHVAVARLLGYRWPRQTVSSFPDCPALGSDGLENADADAPNASGLFPPRKIN